MNDRIRLMSTGISPGICMEFVCWFMDFRLLLWIVDDSGLLTGPLTITKTFKKFL